MIDLRFYDHLGPKTLSEMAQIVGAPPPKEPRASLLIETCGSLNDIGASGLAFYVKSNRGDARDLDQTKAVACLVSAGNHAALPDHVVGLVVKSPRAMFARATSALVARKEIDPASAPIDTRAKLEDTVRLSHHVVVGAGAEIGAGTIIGPGTVIGPGVAIGRNCRIGANVTIYCALIGDHVTISSGCVIGEAGFGVEVTAEGPVDVPQLGRVILQDHVSVGSLCAIDRGAFGDTVLGIGCKIDNFTQIAHNCQLGRGVIMAAFGGVSGSCIIGDNVRMGGRVGIADHTKVGDGATIMAAAGVFKDIPAGESWGGIPAQPVRQWHREVVALKKLVKNKSN